MVIFLPLAVRLLYPFRLHKGTKARKNLDLTPKILLARSKMGFYLSCGMNNFQKFYPLVKVDEATRTVYGLVTAEKPDRDGEICHFASTVPYYNDLRDEFSKATDGKSIAPLREMHQLSAVGVGKSIDFREAERAIYMGFKVVDDVAWKKVQEGVYTGFSQGGNYVKTWRGVWTNPDTQKTAEYTWFTAKPGEVSLVDSPCLKDARFQIVKADGSVEEKTFKVEVAAMPTAPAGSIVPPPYGQAPQQPAEQKCGKCGKGFKPAAQETVCPECGAAEKVAKATELSLDDKRNLVSAACRAKFNAPMLSASAPCNDIWVRELYDGYAIIDSQGADWKVPYTISAEGEVALGEPEKVVQTYVPAEKAKRFCPGCVGELSDGDKCSKCDASGFEKALSDKIDRLIQKATTGEPIWCQCGAGLEPEDIDLGKCQECGTDITDPMHVVEKAMTKTHEGAIAAWETRRAGSGEKPAAAGKPAAGTETGQAREHHLKNTSPGHNKEYHLRQTVTGNKSAVEISFGRIGGGLTRGFLDAEGKMSGSRVLMDHADANRVYEARLNQKLGRGYKQTKVEASGDLEKGDKKTKTVGGKSLSSSAFAYVGDPEVTSTWKYPIHDKSHAQNALARWGQHTGIPKEKEAAVLGRIRAAAKKFGIKVSEEAEKVLRAYQFLTEPVEKAATWNAQQLSDVNEVFEVLKAAAIEDGESPDDLAGLLDKAVQCFTALLTEETQELRDQAAAVAEHTKGETTMTPDELQKAAEDLMQKARSASDHLKALHALHGAHHAKAVAFHKAHMDAAQDVIGKAMKAMGASADAGGGGSASLSVEGTGPASASVEVPAAQGGYPGSPHVKALTMDDLTKALETVTTNFQKAMDDNNTNLLKGMFMVATGQVPEAEGGIGDRTAVPIGKVAQTHPAGGKEVDNGVPKVPAEPVDVRKALSGGDMDEMVKLARTIKSGPIPQHLVGTDGALSKMGA